MIPVKELFKFEEGEVYVLLALSRKKYNPLLKSEQRVFRRVVRKPDEWDRKIKELQTVITNYSDDKCRPEDFNLYVSINPRSLKKAYKLLKQQMAEWDFDQSTLYTHLKKLDNLWISCLLRPESKSRRNYMMIDLDKIEQEEFSNLLNSFNWAFQNKMLEPFQIICSTKTRSGFHMLISSTDTLKLDLFLRDKLSYLSYEISNDRVIYLWSLKDEVVKESNKAQITTDIVVHTDYFRSM
jgi:hypothetical protein